MNLYLENLHTHSGVIEASKDMHQHIRALRLKVGAKVTLFDGMSVCNAELAVHDKRKSELVLVSLPTPVEDASGVRLVIGVTKLPTLEFIFTKATELGVREIILMTTEHTPIKFDQALFAKKEARWQKLIISACEQSGRLTIPSIRYMAMSEYASMTSEKYIACPYAEDKITQFNLQGEFDVVVGPEGGLSESDMEQIDGKRVKLSDTVLRTDTACMAALLAAQLQI